MEKQSRLFIMVGCVVLRTAVSGWANQVIWDLNPLNLNGNVGAANVSVLQDGRTVTGYGFNVNNTPHLLYYKNTGPNEHGIGFPDTTDYELTLAPGGASIANYIQIDVSQIYHDFSAAQIRIQSVTQTEQYDLFGSSTLASIGTKITSGATANDAFFDIPQWGAYPYISVAVTPNVAHPANNVLMDAIAVDTKNQVPDSGSCLLLLAASMGCLSFLQRTKVFGACR